MNPRIFRSVPGGVLQVVAMLLFAAGWCVPKLVLLHYGLDVPLSVPFSLWPVLMLIGFSGLLAFSFDCRPWPSGKYEQWLRSTPWRPGRALPKGRPGPTAWAAAWLVLLVALCVSVGVTPWPPVVAMSLGAIWLAFNRPVDGPTPAVRRLRWAVVLLASSSMWTLMRGDEVLGGDLATHFVDLAGALLVVAGLAGMACYAAMWHAVRFGLPSPRSLADDPLPADAALFLWPAPVAPEPRPRGYWLRVSAASAAAVPLGAVAAVGLQNFGGAPILDSGVWLVTAAAIFAVLAVRALMFTGGRRSQAPLWLRLRSGRWVVLRRDVRLAAALAGAVAAPVVAVAATWVGIDMPEAVGLTWAAVVACVAGVGPSRRWVELCGHGVLRGHRAR